MAGPGCFDQCCSCVVRGGYDRGINVRVFESLDECPEYVRDQLRIVRDAIEKDLSNKTKKLIWGRKTIGLMSVRFSDTVYRVTIAAISGTGVNEWTLEEVAFNNSKLKHLKETLAAKNIVLADLAYEHDEYRKLKEEEAVGPTGDGVRSSDVITPEYRETFAEEFMKRFKNKVEGLRKAKPSREALMAALMKSPAYRPSLQKDFEDYIVPYYMRLANDITVVEWCRRLIELGTPYTAVIRCIEVILSFAKPSDWWHICLITDCVLQFCNIHRVFSGLFIIAVSQTIEKYSSDLRPPLAKILLAHSTKTILEEQCCELILHTRFKDDFESIRRGLPDNFTTQKVIDELNSHNIPEEYRCVFWEALGAPLKNDFKAEFFPHYEKLADFDSYFDSQYKILKEMLVFDGDMSELDRRLIENSKYSLVFLRIAEDIRKADPPPNDVQDVAVRFIKPHPVPEEMLSLFCSALRCRDDSPTASLADITVQCAEDNALAALRGLRRGRTVADIQWVSVTMTKDEEPVYKPLCAFCHVAFPGRAKDVNNWPQQ